MRSSLSAKELATDKHANIPERTLRAHPQASRYYNPQLLKPRKDGPDFKGKPLDCDECLHPKTSEEPYVSEHLVDESSLHPDCQGKKLVWTDGKYFHNEFGFGRDPLGHSYQYGAKICDYYLGALGLPKPEPDQVPDPKK